MFTKRFDTYVCEGDKITCEVEGFTATATIYRDDCSDAPDQRQDGFWPSLDQRAPGYVPRENYDKEMRRAHRVMNAWKNDEWFYCGVAVTIARSEVELTSRYGNALWGIECNYPGPRRDRNAYLLTIANELLPDALTDARATLAKICVAS